MIDTIMLFAAGFGNRMRHLKENNPKTLLPILGKPILYHALELCKNYPFKKIVVNTHYLSKQIEKSIAKFRKENPATAKIIVIYEEEFLETGGAIKNAYNILGNNPIFTLNTDIVLQAKYNIFEFMVKKWDKNKMDFLLLMQPYNDSVVCSGHGDFDLGKKNNLIRPDKQENYEYMYSGLQILKPKKIAEHPLRIFSLREYYLNSDKVIGLPANSGVRWYQATRPEDIVNIEIDMLAHESCQE